MTVQFEGEEFFDLPADVFPEFVGKYFASRSGKFLSVRNTAKGVRTMLLHPTPTRNGYLKVRFSHPHLRLQVLVQRVMAFVFLGLRDPDLEVDHIDEDKLNNHVDNLRVVDHAENMRHAKRNKAFLTGEENPAAKYTDAQVEHVGRLRAAGKTIREIATATGISAGYVSELLNGKKRSASGEPYSTKHRKLTPQETAEIRKAYAEKTADQYELAAKYGVSQSAISNIILGKSHQPIDSTAACEPGPAAREDDLDEGAATTVDV